MARDITLSFAKFDALIDNGFLSGMIDNGCHGSQVTKCICVKVTIANVYQYAVSQFVISGQASSAATLYCSRPDQAPQSDFQYLSYACAP